MKKSDYKINGQVVRNAGDFKENDQFFFQGRVNTIQSISHGFDGLIHFHDGPHHMGFMADRPLLVK